MENILLPILIALLSPIFTVWIALKRFKHEQKWQKKLEVIEELCEIIDRIILQGEIWEKDINNQKQLLGKDSKVFNIFAEELTKLKTRVTIVDILFDWEFSKESDELVSDLEKEYSESVKENNPWDFSYAWLDKMRAFRTKFVKKAKTIV
jgi:3-phosphoglycerate kinase